MQPCPVCMATTNGASACRRCHADLSALLRIEQEAASLTQQAVQLWVAGDVDAAGVFARKSLALKTTPLVEAILFFAVNDPRNSRL